MSDKIKPSWDDAPEWANWLAQDECGRWSWFKWKPTPHKWNHDFDNAGRWISFDIYLPVQFVENWRDTLEPRSDSVEDIENGMMVGSLVSDGRHGYRVSFIGITKMHEHDTGTKYISVCSTSTGKYSTYSLSDFIKKFKILEQTND